MENKKSLTAEEIYEKANKSIAFIDVGMGHGSGVVISKDGLILTNFHCYSDNGLSVKIENKIYKPVEVVAGDVDNDLILLKVKAKNLTPLEIIKEESIKVGTKVYALGTPLRKKLLNTITDGIIGGIRAEYGLRYIQTNAPTYPGNSGGALLNEYCELIGITQSSEIDVITGTAKEGLTMAIHWNVVIAFLRHNNSRVEKNKLPYKKFLYNGIVQMQQKKYSNALKSFNKYIYHFRKDSQAYLLRGQCYEKAGYFKPEAEKDYENCIKYDDKKNPLYSDKAYIGLYRMFENVKYIKRAIKINFLNNLYLLLHEGKENVKNKEYKLAESKFLEIVIDSFTPGEINEKAYVELSNLSFEKREFEDCRNYLDIARQYCDPKDIAKINGYLLESAEILYNENYKVSDVKYIEILEFLLISTVKIKENFEAYYFISKCYADLQDYNRAYLNILGVFDNTKKNKIKERNEFKFYYGLILKNVKKDNSYLPYFQEVLINSDTSDRNDLELIAEIHYEMGEYNQALNEFKKVLKMLPDNYPYPNRKKYLKNKINKIKNILKI